MDGDSQKPVRGMSDICAPEVNRWRRIEAVARDILRVYGCEEIRTPLVEHTAVFLRSLGDTTDVVQKEMYTFADRGGRSLTLRPEGTAGAIRHIAGRGQEGRDARVFYMGPMFRAERPAAGRRRQFHQLGVEVMGDPLPIADAEVMALQAHVLQAWGISNFKMQVNTRGMPEDHVRVASGLRDALAADLDKLCEDCRRRYNENPLRIVDCKNPDCQTVVRSLPPVTHFMGEAARDYLDQVMSWLERLEIPAVRNPYLVRGLDYYMHTVWEVTHTGLGAQDAISGGGRYRLQIGKQNCEGVGFAIGLERILAVLEQQGQDGTAADADPLVYLISQGDSAREENVVLMQLLRRKGLSAVMDLRGLSLKAQMRAANRQKCRYVIIRGETEMEQGTFQFKDMESGAQVELDMPELMERLFPSMQ
jgi:histidyl-tRNA synthetase